VWCVLKASVWYEAFNKPHTPGNSGIAEEHRQQARSKGYRTEETRGIREAEGLKAERGWMTHLAKQLDRQMLKHRLDPRNEWHVGSNETFIIGGDRFDE
jgi:hypothetical protein